MMREQPRSERRTQNRVIGLFTDTTRADCLRYDYLGEWRDRPNNRGIEIELLRANPVARGYTEAQVRNSLYPLMGRDRDATRAIFEIIKQQAGYP